MDRSSIGESEFAGDLDPLRRGLTHRGLDPECWTGSIRLRIEVVTPLVVLDPESRTELSRGSGHESFECLDHLPSSSLRGCIRAAYEAVTNSRFGAFAQSEPLAYRMETGEALSLVPVRIVKGKQGELKAMLLTGTTGQNPQTRPNALYAAWLPRYRKYGRGSKPDRKKHEDSEALKLPTTGKPPAHGDRVWAVVRLRRHSRRPFDFWEAESLHQGPEQAGKRKRELESAARWGGGRRTRQGGERYLVIEGWCCVTGPNVMNKHAERIFFHFHERGREAPQCALPGKVIARYSRLIADYRGLHEEERKRLGPKMADYRGHRIGETGFSRHVWAPGADKLSPGDLVYARVSPDWQRIEALYPVMISRKLYECSPADLASDRRLLPARSLDELSPAERLFGWTAPEAGEGAAGYASRLRIEVEPLPAGAIEQLPGEGLTLPILGSPKPAQGKFYVARDGNGRAQSAGLSRERAGYSDAETKGLRGRKVYWHHRGRENTEDPGYWDPRDPGEVAPSGCRREYRAPLGPDGKPRRSDQNRTIRSWIRPGTVLWAKLELRNVTTEELGALLWMFSLDRECHFRLGFAKPFGLGSVRISIHRPEDGGGALPLTRGEALRARYCGSETSAQCSPEDQHAAIEAFQRAMVATYGDDGDAGRLAGEELRRRFLELPFIAAFLAAARGPRTGLPIHYPRKRFVPDPEGKNFEWFVRNDGRQGAKLTLPDATSDRGLPYDP
jgi:CRISPR-associated protein (TIGR03986 family)